MSTSVEPEDARENDSSRPEIVVAVARQRSARRGVAIGAVLIAAAVITGACSAANASTPKLTGSYSTGHQHGAVKPGDADAESQTGADQNAGDNGDDNGNGNADQNAGADQNNGNGGDNRGGNGDRNGGKNGAGDKQGNGNGGGKGGDKGGDKGNGGGGPQKINGLDVLGRNCDDSKLPTHDGFEKSPACVTTEFGEVAAVDKSPSLLITEAPKEAKVGQDFTLKVSSRNLVRDRFLGAAAGGYYLESSFLNDDGLQRGHFHTACRMLDSTDVAPDSSPKPEFFLATQDNKGGATPDTVDITVTGMPRKGTAQCTVWAGDGSHRIPMMTRANQTPAIDSVRVTVD